jgi:hypothetical protein
LLLETLYAIAVVVGTLKAHAAPPAEPPKAIAMERREPAGDKPKPRTRPEPSLGF